MGTEWLRGACRQLVSAAASWPQCFGEAPAERSYRRLARSGQLEAWLIWWPEGGRLRLHDHGGAAGALGVVSGQLDETYVLPGGALSQRVLGAGQSVAFAGDHIHDVVNRRPSGATSVHVYSPPAANLTFYRWVSDADRLALA